MLKNQKNYEETPEEGVEGEAAATAEGGEAAAPAKEGEAAKKDDKSKEGVADKKQAGDKKPAAEKTLRRKKQDCGVFASRFRNPGPNNNNNRHNIGFRIIDGKTKNLAFQNKNFKFKGLP